MSGIHSLSQFDAVHAIANAGFNDGNSVADLGSAARDNGAPALHGRAMGAMSDAVSNTFEERSTATATGSCKHKIQSDFDLIFHIGCTHHIRIIIIIYLFINSFATWFPI